MSLKFVSETPLRVDAPYINQYFPTFSCKHERLWEFRSRRRRKNLSTSKYILLQRSFKTIQAQKYLIQRILKAFAHHITLHFARFPTLQCLVNYKHIVCHHFSKSASHSLLYKRWSIFFAVSWHNTIAEDWAELRVTILESVEKVKKR